MKSAKRPIIAMLVISTIAFAVYVITVGVRSRNPANARWLKGRSYIERYNSFFQYSNERWAKGAIPINEPGWKELIKDPRNFVWAVGEVFSQKGSIPLSQDQLLALKDKVGDFFETYADGTYESYLRFHHCADFSLDFSGPNTLPEIAAWVDSSKLPYNNDEEKLKALWDFIAFGNAEFVWIHKEMAAKLAGRGVPGRISSAGQLKAMERQFEREVSPGKLGGYLENPIRAIATNDFYVYILTVTNVDESHVCKFASSLMRGAQWGGWHLFNYKNAPQSVVAATGACTFAYVTVAVLIDSCECFTPIVVAFYWSPPDHRWLPWRMCGLAMGHFYTPF